MPKYSDRSSEEDEDEEVPSLSNLNLSLSGQPQTTVRGYYRAVRWTLIAAYLAMAISSLTIFTEDVQICEKLAAQRDCKAVAHFSAMSAIMLAGLGLFSALAVRPLYLLTSAVLLLVLMLYKMSATAAFQVDPVRAMFLHTAHVIVLLCSFALFWVTYFGC